jgi:membrane protein
MSYLSSPSSLPSASGTVTHARSVSIPSRVPWTLLASAAALGLMAAMGKRAPSHALSSGASASGASASGANSPGVEPFAEKDRPASGQAGEPERTGAFGEARSSDEPRVVHRARARQPGRGRRAGRPDEIPARGWKDILWRTYEEMQQDRLMAVAAGVAFYALLAIFPAVTALVSLYGLVFEPTTVTGHLALAASMLPPGGFDIVRDQVDRVVSAGGGGLTFGFLFGIAIALWSANNGVKAIFDALNVIYDEDEKRSFLMLNLVSLTFTLGAIVLFLVFAGAVIVLPLALSAIGFQGVTESLLPLLRWPALLLAVLLALALIYRYGPSRRKAQWRWISVGSLFAAFTWIAGSLAFSWYLQNFANYNAVYGSLGAVIGLMMWLWLSAVVVLLGAELNAETEHQTARDTTVGGDKPLGTRGAAMADNVGEART